MTDSAPATIDEIVYRFNRIPGEHRLRHNWGCAPSTFRDEWQVGPETYINGIVLTIDADYWMGYLIEVVDRTSGAVAFLAVNEYHGHRPDGSIDHDSIVYEKPCGTFFDRTDAADYVTVGVWAVSRIYGMAENYFESRPTLNRRT
jgi:hypothetical protein